MASVLLSGTPAGLSAPSPVLPQVSVEAPNANNAVISMECSTGTRAIQYLTGVTGGGLSQDQWSLWLYGATVGGSGENPALQAYGLGNGYCAVAQNLGRPEEPNRVGIITGTGAPQTIAVPSLTTNSLIQMAYLDGATAAVGTVTPAIVPPVPPATQPTEFQVTLPAGSRFSYMILG